jgi:hypothetical protein
MMFSNRAWNKGHVCTVCSPYHVPAAARPRVDVDARFLLHFFS